MPWSHQPHLKGSVGTGGWVPYWAVQKVLLDCTIHSQYTDVKLRLRVTGAGRDKLALSPWIF